MHNILLIQTPMASETILLYFPGSVADQHSDIMGIIL